jgi:hypothetical protein
MISHRRTDTHSNLQKAIFPLSKAQNLALASSIEASLPRELRDRIYAAYFHGCDCDKVTTQLGVDRRWLSLMRQRKKEYISQQMRRSPGLQPPQSPGPGPWTVSTVDGKG